MIDAWIYLNILNPIFKFVKWIWGKTENYGDFQGKHDFFFLILCMCFFLLMRFGLVNLLFLV